MRLWGAQGVWSHDVAASLCCFFLVVFLCTVWAVQETQPLWGSTYSAMEHLLLLWLHCPATTSHFLLCFLLLSFSSFFYPSLNTFPWRCHHLGWGAQLCSLGGRRAQGSPGLFSQGPPLQVPAASAWAPSTGTKLAAPSELFKKDKTKISRNSCRYQLTIR